jgi:hypothetical protein
MPSLARLSAPFTALFALWFAIVLGDPGMLHACPMHGGGHGAHGTEQASAPAPSHDTPGMHEHHTAGHSATHESDQGSRHDVPAPAGPCTCVGHCCAAAALAPLPTVASLPVPAAVAQERDPLDAPSVVAPASPGLRLPFANGPPAV